MTKNVDQEMSQVLKPILNQCSMVQNKIIFSILHY